MTYDKISAVAMEHVVPVAMLNEIERQCAEGMSDAQADAWIAALRRCKPAYPRGGEKP